MASRPQSDTDPQEVFDPGELRSSEVARVLEAPPVVAGCSQPEAAEDPATPANRTGGLFDGRYRVLELLGEGGYGAVYRAFDPELGRDVAIKTTPASSRKASAPARLRREAELTAKLRHPGIVRVHDYGETRGTSYIVYELVEGGRSLDQAFAAWSLLERARALKEVAEAVGHAHAAGVLHRDLKPFNVLVDADGRIRVLDFGLATAENLERLTATGMVVGTHCYLAPEQLRGLRDAVGPASDVWALGVMLYEALTGEHPFAADDAPDLSRKILAARPPSPRSRCPEVSPELEAVCLRALQADPAARFADGAQLAAALAEALAPAPASPRSRRTPVWPAVAGALLVAAGAHALGFFGSATGGSSGPALAVADLEAELRLAWSSVAPLASRSSAGPRARGLLEAARREAQSAPGPTLGPALDALAADVRALEGLLALARSDLPAARRALSQEGLPQGSPAQLALRGALMALDPDADPARAADDLGAAISAGLQAPELRRWLELAQARARWRKAAADAPRALARGQARATRKLLEPMETHLARLGGRALEARSAAAVLRAAEARLATLLVDHPEGPMAPPLRTEVMELLRLALHLGQGVSLSDWSVQRLLGEATGVAAGLTGDPELGLLLAEAAPTRREVQLKVAILADFQLDVAGLPTGFEVVLRRAISLAERPAERWQGLRRLGFHLLRDGSDWREAEEVLSRAVEEAPTVGAAAAMLRLRAKARRQLMRHAEALEDVDRALEPPAVHSDGLLFLRGSILFDLQRWEEAIEAAEAHLRAVLPWVGSVEGGSLVMADSAAALVWDASQQLERPARARWATERLVELRPDLSGWWLRLALLRLRDGDLEGARAAADSAQRCLSAADLTVLRDGAATIQDLLVREPDSAPAALTRLVRELDRLRHERRENTP